MYRGKWRIRAQCCREVLSSLTSALLVSSSQSEIITVINRLHLKLRQNYQISTLTMLIQAFLSLRQSLVAFGPFAEQDKVSCPK